MSGGRDLGPVDAYVAGFEGDARAALVELRALLREAVPGATETISYGIPTLDLHGRHVLHYAGYVRHVGLYPTPRQNSWREAGAVLQSHRYGSTGQRA